MVKDIHDPYNNLVLCKQYLVNGALTKGLKMYTSII